MVDLLVAIIIWGLVLAVLWWGVGRLPLPAPFNTVAQVILVILTVVILVNLLLGFTGGSSPLRLRG